MHVWLVKLEESLPIDTDYRPYRMGMLADSLLDAGHMVTRWASDFDHIRRTYRRDKSGIVHVNDRYSIYLLHQKPAYKNALSLNRFINNTLIKRQFEYIARKQSYPDLIVCSMPTPAIAAAAARLSSAMNIPLVLDARDYWPDIIQEELKGVRAIVALPVIWKMKQDLKFAAKRASSLVGITDYYVDHLVNYSGRARSSCDVAFPLGFNETSVELNENNEKGVESFWIKQNVDLSGTSAFIYFAGRLNKTVHNAFLPVLNAAEILEKRYPDIKFIICGIGCSYNAIREMSVLYPNIIFPGEVSAKALSLLRKKATAALLPIERREDYQNSLSNKYFEYLSGGMPILSGLSGLPGKILKENKCGFVYEDGKELSMYIAQLIEDDNLRNLMGENAIKLFNTNYKSSVVYASFVKHLERISGSC